MNTKAFVNPFTVDAALIARLAAAPVPALTFTRHDSGHAHSPATVATGVLSGGELDELGVCLDAQPWTAVGHDGILEHFDPDRDEIGSWRASAFEPQLADVLFARLGHLLASPRIMDERTPTDWDGHRVWRPVGVNPLMRFIRYRPGGLLVPHYDAPYDYGDERRRTLVTLVFYLEARGAQGGQTRFIADPQTELALAERDYSDWQRLAQPTEIVTAVSPAPGSVLAFDHRILHDSAPLRSGSKTIMRTDVIYERA
jgi:hypothetical protein